jgi:hypothetical protein
MTYVSVFHLFLSTICLSLSRSFLRFVIYSYRRNISPTNHLTLTFSVWDSIGPLSLCLYGEHPASPCRKCESIQYNKEDISGLLSKLIPSEIRFNGTAGSETSTSTLESPYKIQVRVNVNLYQRFKHQVMNTYGGVEIRSTYFWPRQ